VPQGLRIFTAKCLPTPAALGGLEDLDAVRRLEGPTPPLVPGLAAAQAARGLARRAALGRGWVGGGRPGRVRGVLIEPFGEFLDLPLKRLDSGLQLGHLGPLRQD
jgi:hypothetical protein